MGEEGGNGAAMDFTQVGLMQKLSTGNMVFDVIVCLFIPFLFKEVFPRFQDWVEARARTLKTWGEFTRYIEHTDQGGYWWCQSDTEPANNVLQKSILLYIATQETYTQRFNTACYNLDKTKHDDAGCSDDESDASSDCGDDTARELAAFTVNTVPTEGIWQRVGERIWFMRESQTISNKDYGRDKVKTIFHIRARGRNAKAAADGFVDAAFNHYRAKMAAQVDTTRYLYQPLKSAAASPSNGDGDSGGTPGTLYKRYALSDDKSFDCVFHPVKRQLLSLLRDFNSKSGKYAIRGYPHKLGLLLHGPPGTGKTSLIKALATATGRSVVSVPLDKVKTNQQLCDIVFDQRFAVQGEDLPKRLTFSKTIFVFEDIDAAGGVVNRRAPRAASMTPAELAALHAIAANDAASPAPATTPGDAAKGRRDPAGKPGGGADGGGGAGGGSASGSSGAGAACDSGAGPSTKLSAALSLLEDPDKLNLAGLLNVLDGVVDTPGRIVVMTTNHPENLDPALIRPGRIDFQVYMGRIAREEAGQMIAHYYGAAFDAAAAARLDAVFVDDALTPAELEAMCANCRAPDDLLRAIAAVLGTADRDAARGDARGDGCPAEDSAPKKVSERGSAAEGPGTPSVGGSDGGLSSHALVDVAEEEEVECVSPFVKAAKPPMLGLEGIAARPDLVAAGKTASTGLPAA